MAPELCVSNEPPLDRKESGVLSNMLAICDDTPASKNVDSV